MLIQNFEITKKNAKIRHISRINWKKLMKIAIHAADLDHERIDGTRVYLANMLKNFGDLSSKDSFLIYHQNNFNPALAPPKFSNYEIRQSSFSFLWTQTRFAWDIFRDAPAVLWMPVHNVPIFRKKGLKVVVTIHDLAFKIFPEYFPKKDLIKLNLLTDLAVKNADKIIAVSNATKMDILKFYPKIKEEKVVVIHHGFDSELFSQKVSIEESEKILSKFKLLVDGQKSKYILYVGAIQPRKNLDVLLEAFEKMKESAADFAKDLKLVIAGAPAWKYEGFLEKVSLSKYSKEIVVTGTLTFEKLPALYQNAAVFVFPSIYEGFGIPILEAFASGVPVICARNSSLLEVAGDCAESFDTKNSQDLFKKIKLALEDEKRRADLIEKGFLRVKDFSWEKCAKKTLEEISNF